MPTRVHSGKFARDELPTKQTPTERRGLKLNVTTQYFKYEDSKMIPMMNFACIMQTSFYIYLLLRQNHH